MATPEQIPAGVDWEDDQCSPYRRRDRPVGVRRGRGGRAVRLLRVASLDVLLPLLLMYGVYWCSLHAAAPRRFRLDPETDVSFAGNHIASRARMIEALGFGGTGGLSVRTLNLSAERKRVQELPWVKSAAVARIFPHRLEVRVVERTPVAFVNVSGRVELVGSDGRFLPIPAKASFDFPVLYGLDSAPSFAERKDRLDLYLQFLKETRKEIAGSGWTISQADLSRPDDLRLLLVREKRTIWVHVGDTNFKQRFETFITLAPRMLQNYFRIDSMDLRFHNEVVVDPDKGIAPASSGKKGGVTAPQ